MDLIHFDFIMSTILGLGLAYYAFVRLPSSYRPVYLNRTEIRREMQEHSMFTGVTCSSLSVALVASATMGLRYSLVLIALTLMAAVFNHQFTRQGFFQSLKRNHKARTQFAR